MKKAINTKDIQVGIVGLGLMGCSITTCLLMANHPVVAVAPLAADLDHASDRIRGHLQGAYHEGLIHNEPEHYLSNLIITDDYKKLADCKLVLECIIENVDIKKEVYKKIEDVVSKTPCLPVIHPRYPSVFCKNRPVIRKDFSACIGWSLLIRPDFSKSYAAI